MENHKVIVSAVMRILASLTRVLLRNGIHFSAFADIAKKAYVSAAMEDFTIQGREQSILRISILTGLHRKEVKTIQQALISGDDSSLDGAGNRAARVISGWRIDPEFLDEQGQPARLPLKGNGATFEALVKRFSGNMPVRAILDELERVDAVARTDDDWVQLMTHTYLPKGDDEMKLHILGTDVSALISTIEHNLNAAQVQAHLQRKVSYNNLPQEVMAEFREFSGAKAQNLLDEFDRYMAQHDRDTNSAIDGTGRYTAGIGIFYFEKRS